MISTHDVVVGAGTQVSTDERLPGDVLHVLEVRPLTAIPAYGGGGCQDFPRRHTTSAHGQPGLACQVKYQAAQKP